MSSSATLKRYARLHRALDCRERNMAFRGRYLTFYMPRSSSSPHRRYDSAFRQEQEIDELFEQIAQILRTIDTDAARSACIVAGLRGFSRLEEPHMILFPIYCCV